MASDLIKVLRELRGDGEAEAPYENGIYYDITMKTTEDDNVTPRLGEGLYGSMIAMYGNILPLVPYTDEIITLGGLSDELSTLGDTETSTALNRLNTGNTANNIDRLSDVTTVVSIDRLNTGDTAANIDTLASIENINSITTVAEDLNSIDFNNRADIITVADDLVLGTNSNITKVSADIDNVNITAVNIPNIDIVANDITDVSDVASNMIDINALGPIVADIVNVSAVHPAVTRVSVSADSVDRLDTGNTADAIDRLDTGTTADSIDRISASADEIDRLYTSADAIDRLNTGATADNIDALSGPVTIAAMETLDDLAIISNMEILAEGTTPSAIVLLGDAKTAAALDRLNEGGVIPAVDLHPGTDLYPDSSTADNIDILSERADALDRVEVSIENVDTVAANMLNIDSIANNMADIEYFADRYQGPKDVEPTLRNDGSALQVGDMYFDISPVDPLDYSLKMRTNTTWETSSTIAYSKVESDALYQPIDPNIVSDGAYVHTDNNYVDADKAKVDFVTVTSNVDLDTINSDVVLNNAKVTNYDQTKVDIDALGIDAATLDTHGSTYFGTAAAVALNTAKVTNVSTNLSKSATTTDVTVNSSDGTNVALGAASTSVAGVMTKAMYDEHILNNAKVSDIDHNVTTNLSTVTTATTNTVVSSDGTNAVLPAATTTVAGVMTGDDKTKLDGIIITNFLDISATAQTKTGALTIGGNFAVNGTVTEFDLGQTLQNVTASRAPNVTYTNNTGKPIIVWVYTTSVASSYTHTAYIDDELVWYQKTQNYYTNGLNTMLLIVPNGSTYRVVGATFQWKEFR